MNKKLVAKIVLATLVVLVIVTLAVTIVPTQTAFAADANGHSTTIAAASTPYCSSCKYSWNPFCSFMEWIRSLFGQCKYK